MFSRQRYVRCYKSEIKEAFLVCEIGVGLAAESGQGKYCLGNVKSENRPLQCKARGYERTVAKMKTQHFDAKLFESLTGMDLWRYVSPFIKSQIAIVENEILPYFEKNATRLDMAHLELALTMLGKVGSVTAFQKVAAYLDYSFFSVRFIAVKTISNMTVVDEVIMSLVVESLKEHQGELDFPKELTVVLDRPANAEARRIAEDYRLYQSRKK